MQHAVGAPGQERGQQPRVERAGEGGDGHRRRPQGDGAGEAHAPQGRPRERELDGEREQAHRGVEEREEGHERLAGAGRPRPRGRSAGSRAASPPRRPGPRSARDRAGTAPRRSRRRPESGLVSAAGGAQRADAAGARTRERARRPTTLNAAMTASIAGTGTSPAALQASRPPDHAAQRGPEPDAVHHAPRRVGVEQLVDQGPEAGERRWRRRPPCAGRRPPRPGGDAVTLSPHSASSRTVPAASAAGTTRAGERRARAAENASTASAETQRRRDHGQRQRRDVEGGEEERVAGGLARHLLGDERARGDHHGDHRSPVAGAFRRRHVVWTRAGPAARRRLYYAMPNAPRASCAVALGLLLAGSATAHAQIGLSLNRAGSGARAAGMGDAFIAVSDDGTAASWNPAGLAQLRQPEFSLVYVVSDQRPGLHRRALAGRAAWRTRRRASPTPTARSTSRARRCRSPSRASRSPCRSDGTGSTS